MAWFFSLLANLALVTANILYFRQVVKGHSTPNPATWLIWLIISIMNMITYYQVVAGNLVEWILTLTMTIGSTGIFLYSLFRGKFGRVGMVELICFSLALLVGVFWKTTGNAIIANVFLQVILFISFLPTVFGLVHKSLREQTLAWDVSLCAYVFVTMAIVIDWKEGSLLALVYPIVNGIIGNGSVALTIRLTRNNRDL